MIEIARLTAETTIERDEYGRAWIVTEDRAVAEHWYDLVDSVALITDGFNDWWSEDVSEWHDGMRWSVPLLTAHREVYAYRKGEPWCWEDEDDECIMCWPARTEPWKYPGQVYPPCHANVIALCGSDWCALRTYLDIVKAEEETG